MGELRYALRSIRLTAGLSFFIVAVLTTGIAAAVSIFSVVNGVLLHPLDIPDRSRVFVFFENRKVEAVDRYSFSPANFYDFRDAAKSYERMGAAVIFSGMGVNVAGQDRAERLTATVVTSDFLDVMRYGVIAGRSFTPEDEKPGANTVLISKAFWERRYHSSAAAIGSSILIDGLNRTVVGVLSDKAQYPENTDIWGPWEQKPDLHSLRAVHFLTVAGRLKPGVSEQAAAREADTIAARLSAAYPAENTETGIPMIPIEEYLVGDVRKGVLLLMGAVGLMLALACANVAGLLLSRESSRRREHSVRIALGASQWQLIRPLLVQALVLSLASGVLAAAASVVAVRYLASAIAGQMPRAAQVSVDGRVLLFALVISLLTGLVFGLVPAWSMSRWRINDSLKDGSHTTDARAGRLRDRLVIAQIAVSLVLLCGAALLARSFVNLLRVNPGFQPENVLTMRVSLPDSRYGDDSKVLDFYQRLNERIARMPGVLSHGYVNTVPLAGEGPTAWLNIEGRTWKGTPPEVLYRTASGGYFRALGIPLRAGRLFDDNDRTGHRQVILVNETLARRFFPGENPIGRHVRLGPGTGAFYEIVGVVGDMRQTKPNRQPQPEAFECFLQSPFSNAAIVIRTGSDPRPLAAAVQAAVRQIDPGQPIYDIATMQQVMSRSVSSERLYATLLGVFAVLAVTLSMMGLYALLSHSVAQRTAEIGVRSALGAQPADILRFVFGHSARLVGGGVLAGLLACLVALRPLRSFLFGLKPADASTYMAVLIAVAVVSLAASYFPARRASAIDPVSALRNE